MIRAPGFVPSVVEAWKYLGPPGLGTPEQALAGERTMELLLLLEVLSLTNVHQLCDLNAEKRPQDLLQVSTMASRVSPVRCVAINFPAAALPLPLGPSYQFAHLSAHGHPMHRKGWFPLTSWTHVTLSHVEPSQAMAMVASSKYQPEILGLFEPQRLGLFEFHRQVPGR